MKESVEFEAVIKSYVKDVTELCSLLKKELVVNNLLEAWKNSEISKTGNFGESDKYCYDFHGIGCSIESDSLFVDFDFGFNGRLDGFDLWRLKRYIYENEKFVDSIFKNEDKLNASFETLVQNKIIFCPKWLPSEHLYYFCESENA